MKTIICHFSLFDSYQNVYLVDSETETHKHIATTTMEELGQIIANSCQATGTNKVHLFGNKQYADAIINDIIDNYNNQAYSNHTIEIEVN